MANKSQEFVELYHSIIPDKDVRERVPVLVHGPKRLVDHTTIVVSAACSKHVLLCRCRCWSVSCCACGLTASITCMPSHACGVVMARLETAG